MQRDFWFRLLAVALNLAPENSLLQCPRQAVANFYRNMGLKINMDTPSCRRSWPKICLSAELARSWIWKTSARCLTWSKRLQYKKNWAARPGQNTVFAFTIKQNTFK